MKSFAYACLVTALLSLTTAQSLNTSQEYYLKTVASDPSSQFNNLYLDGYHSGAGFNDAVLLPFSNNSLRGWLNGTFDPTSLNGSTEATNGQQLFQIGDYPYGLYMDQVNTYAGWEPTGINVGNGDPGFYFNSTTGSLSWAEYGVPYTDFGGWLVCQWWRGVPQLFWIVEGIFVGDAVPDCCECVDLVPQYI